MTKKEILEKVQKLLALANSSNEHEAQIAATRAQAMITKYNLTQKEISDDQEKYSKEIYEMGRQRMEPSWKYIQSILRDFFFVEIVSSKKRVSTGDILTDLTNPKYEIVCIIFGQDHNIQIAMYVRKFLQRSFRQLFKEYAKTAGNGPGVREGYYMGLYKGLVEKLKETRKVVEDETGLVVVPDADLNDFVKESLGETKNKKSLAKGMDREALSAGYKDGKNLNIAMGLGGEESNKQVGQGALRLGGSK